MTNFNFEGFEGYSEVIIAGPEVADGTGEVYLRFHEDCDSILVKMPWDDVIRLSDWLAKLAEQAREAQREENREREIIFY